MRRTKNRIANANKRVRQQKCYCIGSTPCRCALHQRLDEDNTCTRSDRNTLVIMDFVINNIPWLTLAVVSGAMLFIPMLRGASADALSPAQAVMLVNRQNALLLDVRDTDEFQATNIVGARNIPLSELETRINELSKYRAKPVVTVCATGNRSGRAVDLLRKAGFEQVYNLAGGLNAWRDAGQPLSTKKVA